MAQWINGDGSPAFPPLEDNMIEVTEAGQALMSPEEIKLERERREAAQRLRDSIRFEQQKRMWHLWSYLLPIAATILGASFVGIVFFVAFKIMGEAWMATAWH